MTLIVRFFWVILLAVAVSACSGAAPTGSALDPASRANIVISDVRVDTSKMGANTAGRQVPTTTVQSMVQREADVQLRGQGPGPRQARAILAQESVNIITAGQSILVGGESVMRGTVALQDVNTGETILALKESSSGGGGWTGGGLVAVATRDDAGTELRQMSNEFAARSRILLLGNPVGAVAPAAAPAAASTTTQPEVQATRDVEPVQLTEAEQKGLNAERDETVRCIRTVRFCR